MSSSNGSLSKKLEQVTKQLQETSNKIEVLEVNVDKQSKIITAKDTELLEKNAAVEEIQQNLLAVEESMQAKVDELSAVSEHLLIKTKELEMGQSAKQEEVVLAHGVRGTRPRSTAPRTCFWWRRARDAGQSQSQAGR